MKIESIRISVFETKSHSPPFQLVEETRGAHHRWLRQSLGPGQDHLAGKVPAQVLGELGHALVAVLGVVLGCLEHDGFQFF